MNIGKIKKLIEIVNQTNISELEIRESDESIKITNGNIVRESVQCHGDASFREASRESIEISQVRESYDPVSCEENHIIKSPMVGTVFLSSSPEKEPFVKVGQRVTQGETICIIEAMKMFNKV